MLCTMLHNKRPKLLIMDSRPQLQISGDAASGCPMRKNAEVPQNACITIIASGSAVVEVDTTFVH